MSCDIHQGKWKKVGTFLPSDAHYNIMGDLVIRNVKLKHSGIYQCQSMNNSANHKIFKLYVGSKKKQNLII